MNLVGNMGEKKQLSWMYIQGGIQEKKWFRVISAIALDAFLFMQLMNFLLYRAILWDRIYILSRETIDALILGTMCASALLEFAYSPVRALLAVGMFLLRRIAPLTDPQALLGDALFVAIVSNLGSRKNNMNTWLAIHALGIEILFIFRLIGLARPAFAADGKIPFGLGSSFALVHPNTFALLCMSVLMMIWLYRKHKIWTTFILYFVGAAAIFYYTWSRTTFVVMLLFPFLLVAIYQLKKLLPKTAHIIIISVPIIMILITLSFSTYAVVKMQGHATSAFWFRFTDFKVLVNRGLSLFGREGTGPYSDVWFDNVYWWLTSYCGVIPTIMVLTGYCWMNIKLYRQKQYELLAIGILFLIFGLMENALVYPFQYFVPLLAFARPDEQEENRKILADNSKLIAN